MSDERATKDDGDAPDTATTGRAPPPEADLSLAAAPDGVPTGERVDEDGLPLDRPATLDDVRSESGSGRTIAIGCTLLVLLVLGLFWVIRAGLLR